MCVFFWPRASGPEDAAHPIILFRAWRNKQHSSIKTHWTILRLDILKVPTRTSLFSLFNEVSSLDAFDWVSRFTKASQFIKNRLRRKRGNWMLVFVFVLPPRLCLHLGGVGKTSKPGSLRTSKNSHYIVLGIKQSFTIWNGMVSFIDLSWVASVLTWKDLNPWPLETISLVYKIYHTIWRDLSRSVLSIIISPIGGVTNWPSADLGQRQRLLWWYF